MRTSFTQIKKYVFPFVASVVIPFCSLDAMENDNVDSIATIKRMITLPKSSFLVREPIWIVVSCINQRQKPQETFGLSVDRLIVIDSLGNAYESSCSSQVSAFRVLAPHDTLWYEFDLLQYYGIPENKFRTRHYLPAGRYTVYEVIGKQRSNVLEFIISDPDTTENISMGLLKKGVDLWTEKNWEAALLAFREITERYPGSIYAPLALFTEAQIYEISIEDAEQALEMGYKLIHKYPTSGCARMEVSVVSTYYHNKDLRTGNNEQYAAMLDLINKFPDTGISKIAMKIIKNIEQR